MHSLPTDSDLAQLTLVHPPQSPPGSSAQNLEVDSMNISKDHVIIIPRFCVKYSPAPLHQRCFEVNRNPHFSWTVDILRGWLGGEFLT